MAILSFIRNKFKLRSAKKPMEYVREQDSHVGGVSSRSRIPDEYNPIENEIDLSHQADLEGYARDHSVSKESIERWISSGLLMPDEMKAAEKLVKLINRQ